MKNSLTINAGSVVPVDTIRFILPIGTEERTRLVERYGEDAADFNIAIHFADKSTKLARQSLDDVRGQGIGLVNVGADRHVVAANIKRADPFTKDDAAKLVGERGYTLSQTFRSRVETTAGTVLSSATPAQIMERRSRAIETSGPKTPAQG
jgi:hypothetical protein